MERNVNSLIGFSMEALDGEIGKVAEFYFDDQTWTVRYLIVETGSWLNGRKVLVSPTALINKHSTFGTFPVNLTKEQIRNSPDIDTNKPVSRQQETELYGYYPWQSYWGTSFYTEGIWQINNSYGPIDQPMVNEADQGGKRLTEDQHLRSTHAVNGYHIHALDGEIGRVMDFILEDQTWQVTYLVVDARHWFDSKRVMIPISKIKSVQWMDSQVVVDLSINSIKDSKIFDEAAFTYAGRADSSDIEKSLHLTSFTTPFEI